MPKHVDLQAIERAARAKLDTRIEAVKTLATARQNKLDKQAQATAAEHQDTTAWIAAIRQGWSENELKELGFDPPRKKAPGRPRRRRSTGPSGGQSATSVGFHEGATTNDSATDQAGAESPDAPPVR